MLNIGDFAGITGLSVKALRHYDEKGLLVPDSVDERSGYRRYGEGQVRAGATVRALRAAGLSLPEIAEAAAQDSAVSAVRAHRDRVLVEREREDRAFAAAEQELRALRVPVSIELRHAPEQHFVGRPLHAPSEDPDALTDDDANATFAELYGQLVGAGIPLSGEFWTALRSGSAGTSSSWGAGRCPARSTRSGRTPATTLASSQRAPNSSPSGGRSTVRNCLMGRRIPRSSHSSTRSTSAASSCVSTAWRCGRPCLDRIPTIVRWRSRFASTSARQASAGGRRPRRRPISAVSGIPSTEGRRGASPTDDAHGGAPWENGRPRRSVPLRKHATSSRRAPAQMMSSNHSSRTHTRRSAIPPR
ncbi:MerR family transcriptional regulator [Leucobacter luti]|nr:MerR family transcriptional regulator [Leucobacter luti]